MKLVMQNRYGGPDVLEITERPVPDVKAGNVLIRVHAATVTLADCAFRKADPFIIRFFGGMLRPKDLVLGDDIAGVVEAVGAGITRFHVGQAVYGSVGEKLGGMAEYVCLPDSAAIVAAPAGQDLLALSGLSYSYLTAMPFMRDEARLKPGDKVLINGAASSVGAIAVQLAKHFGAEVTAVASARHEVLLRSLGADHFLDRHASDFMQARSAYDVVFDAVGKSSFGRCVEVLKPGGIYLTTVPTLSILWLMLTGGRRKGRRGKLATTGLRAVGDKRKDLLVLNDLLEQGVLRPVMDRAFPLERVADAHAYVEAETKAGDVFVVMSVADQLSPPRG